MRKGWTICLLTLLCTSMTGCNQMGVKQNPSSAFDQVRDHFSAQDSYAFYGRTKLLTENSANANVVNFSGRKDKDAVYMNVKLSMPDEKRVDSLSLLHQGDKLYAKQGSDAAWKNVAHTQAAYQQEMDNWDPASCFSQMADMQKNIRQLPDEDPNDDVEAIRVTLDSAKLKNWLVTQMNEQTQGTETAGSHIQSAAAHKPRLKLAMALSDGSWKKSATGQKGPRIQSESNPAPNVREIVDQMDVNADYTVYYNRTSMLPTTITMSIRSQYDVNGQRVNEHSQVETYLQSYGRVKPLPTPTESQSSR
ncbi:hypothetical protein EDM59_25450 [Brevibacillus nitrificans]|uniref:Uncharacterized protein n=1 Tax=Brevibacillus nitrificans TaxID=651560 RepID=A0A3M8D0I7_9BACL|nr:hypothetical protein [Brevibacillus nitrificans]RNB80665.1 hypothetical protein EDM59_25450 [Brevibacillus nitrificans]